jgi:hypothetical protein
LLLVLASTVILGFESQGTHDLVLFSDGSGSLSIFVVFCGYLHTEKEGISDIAPYPSSSKSYLEFSPGILLLAEDTVFSALPSWQQ